MSFADFSKPLHRMNKAKAREWLAGLSKPVAKTPRGRPPIPAAQRRDRTVSARVTAEEEAKWRRLGGAEWLRGALKRARDI